MLRTTSRVSELLKRGESTLSSKQVEKVLGGDVKFPLYVYLRDLQRSQDATFESIDKKFEGVTKKFEGIDKTLKELKVAVTRMPLLAFAAAVAGMSLVEYCGYQLRLLPHEGTS